MQFHDLIDATSWMNGERRVNHAVDYSTRTWVPLPSTAQDYVIRIPTVNEATALEKLGRGWDYCDANNANAGTRVDNDGFTFFGWAEGRRNNQPVKCIPTMIRPNIQATMSSVIVGHGGGETGSLMMSFPSTSATTVATSPEVMRIQERVFMGACVTKPENIVLCLDAYFQGLKGGLQFRTRIGNNPDLFGQDVPYMIAAREISDQCGVAGCGSNPPADTEPMFTQSTHFYYNNAMPQPNALNDADTARQMGANSLPVIGYIGATACILDGKMTVTQRNNGHLGQLDCPDKCGAMSGGYTFMDDAPLAVSVQ